MYLLTDKQIRESYKEAMDNAQLYGADKEPIPERAVAIDQSRNIAQKLDEPCTDHPIPGFTMVTEMDGETQIFYNKPSETYYQHRYLCPQCIQEFLKEVNNEQMVRCTRFRRVVVVIT